MMPNNKQIAADLIAKYKQAWEQQDTDLALSIFTNSASYHDSAYGKPVAGGVYKNTGTVRFVRSKLTFRLPF